MCVCVRARRQQQSSVTTCVSCCQLPSLHINKRHAPAHTSRCLSIAALISRDKALLRRCLISHATPRHASSPKLPVDSKVRCSEHGKSESHQAKHTSTAMNSVLSRHLLEGNFPPNVSSFPPKVRRVNICFGCFFLAFTILHQQMSADGMLIYSKECNERRSA